MADITVSEDRLREVLEVAMEHGAIGAGAQVDECVDDVMSRLAMPNHERLLDEARYIVVTDDEKGVYRQIAAAYIAKCSEQSAKPDVELDNPLDREWVESKLRTFTESNHSVGSFGAGWWLWNLKYSRMVSASAEIRLFCEKIWYISINGIKTTEIKSRRQFLALCEGLGVELQAKKGGAE